MNLPPTIMKQIRLAQRLEASEALVYQNLARREKRPDNRAVLLQIADDEQRHADFWATHTGKPSKPFALRVGFYTMIAWVLGLTFALKLMERGEELAQIAYGEIEAYIPESRSIVEDEARHEQELLAVINEERLDYMGSIVLGLNDALVELTGTLAGLSFAFQNSRIIGFAGLITGIAASMSMAASDYLSQKADGNAQRALRSSAYTGLAYIATVILLVLPYLLGLHYLFSLSLTLMMAMAIIAAFNFYLAVAKDLKFLPRFLEMAGISLGVSLLSFLIGWAVKYFFGIEV